MHIVDLKWQNRLKVGTDKSKLNVKMQSVTQHQMMMSEISGKDLLKSHILAGGERCWYRCSEWRMLHRLEARSRFWKLSWACAFSIGRLLWNLRRPTRCPAKTQCCSHFFAIWMQRFLQSISVTQVFFTLAYFSFWTTYLSNSNGVVRMKIWRFVTLKVQSNPAASELTAVYCNVNVVLEFGPSVRLSWVATTSKPRKLEQANPFLAESAKVYFLLYKIYPEI